MAKVSSRSLGVKSGRSPIDKSSQGETAKKDLASYRMSEEFESTKPGDAQKGKREKPFGGIGSTGSGP